MHSHKRKRSKSRQGEATKGPGSETSTARSGPPAFGALGITRRELVLVLAVVAAGIGLRLYALSRSAVEHFDEGVYASNIYFAGPQYVYPGQKYYAPPLLPALIETGMIAGLAPNLAALLPSFIAGCATIVALWWVGRSWFGPGAGLAAATLVAISPFHIAYSAAAMTDALLGLWLVLAVDAAGRSVVGTLRVPSSPNGTQSVPTTYGDVRWAVGAGLYTGLAWWTKYNGWLPLAIEGAAIPLAWLLLRPPRRQLAGWLGCCAVTAVVAAAVWSPYYFSLQASGGYGPIAANHARYAVGFAGWFDSAARQIANQWVIETPLAVLGTVLAVMLPGFLTARTAGGVIRRAGAGVLAGALAAGWSSFVVVGAGGLVGLLTAAVSVAREGQSNLDHRRRVIGLALAAAWWGGLLVATPCYWPYPRLVLPWLLAASIGLGLSCDLLDGEGWPAAWNRQRWRTIAAGVIVIVAVAAPWFVWPRPTSIELSPNRLGLLHIAASIHATATDQPRAIYVYGEPALFFQLRAAGEEIVAAIEDVPRSAVITGGRPIATLLAVGPQSRTDSRFQEQWAAAKDRWELVKTYAYRPSAVVWLDGHDPRKPPRDVNDAITIYRLRP